MKKAALSFLVLFSLFSLPARAARNMVELAVHKLTLLGHAQYYGSALLIQADRAHLRFVTAAHVVPQSREDQKALRISGAFTHYSERPLKVLSVRPGEDIALLEIPLEGLSSEITEQLPALLEALWLRQNLPEGAVADPAGLMGFEDPDPSQTPRINPLSWQVSATVDMKALDLDRLPPSEIRIKDQSLCGPLFVWNCYELNVDSDGFSGGAFYVGAPHPTSEVTSVIAGMVTHYSPLAPKTYVIPSSRLFHALDEALKGNETHDEFFEVTGPNEVRVQKGMLEGFYLRGRGPQKQGGGDISGGGGDISGGGGDISGGGAVLASGGIFSQPRLRALFRANPLLFKGSEAVVEYRPGIELLDSNHRLVKRAFGLRSAQGETRVDTLSQFLKAYESLAFDKTLKLIEEAPALEFPLGLVAREWGLFVLARVSPRETTAKSPVRTALLGRLLSKHELVFEFPKSPARIHFQLLGEWVQSGARQFRYEGPAEARSSGFKASTRLDMSGPQRVTLVLEQDLASSLWDLKFLSAMQLESAVLFPQDEHLFGAALRLGRP